MPRRRNRQRKGKKSSRGKSGPPSAFNARMVISGPIELNTKGSKPNSTYTVCQWGVPSIFNSGGDNTFITTLGSGGGNATMLRFCSSAAATTGWCSWALAFMLNDITSSTDYINMYDQYRIKRIDMIIIPSVVGMIGNQSTTTIRDTPPLLLTVAPDFDDATAPTSSAYLDQYQAAKVFPHLGTGGNLIEISVKPHIAMAAYASGVFGAYANISDQWIDVASAGVQHFGIKGAYPGSSNTTYGQACFDCKFRYTLEFRNVR